MKMKLKLIELVSFEGIDEFDNERIEDRYIIGYFSNDLIKNEALDLCKKEKNKDEEIIVTDYEISCSPNQQYVYVLFYEYSILHDKQYQDFYEYYEPLSNYKKCNDMKKRLCKKTKYKKDSNKIYDGTIDGFHIEKIKINYISHINFH